MISSLLLETTRFSSSRRLNPGVVRRMNTHFSSAVLLALTTGDKQLALDTYETAEALPATSTLHVFEHEGWSLDGPLFTGSDLVLCFKGLHAFVLKGLSEAEARRAQTFAAVRGEGHPCIVSFELHHSVGSGKNYMTMPKFPATIEQIPLLSPADSLTLWNDTRAALEYLHGLGFAHMDIKPSNICVNASARCVLVDIGSVAAFMTATQTTVVYVPLDVEHRLSDASVDWWMLAMTLAKKCCGEHPLNHEAGTMARPTKAELRQHLSAYLPPLVWSTLDEVLSRFA
jgi:serine/threonine protein kinase